MFQLVLYRILTPLLFCLISVVGTVGNGLVIYVISFRRKMWTLTNIMLLNLALADMCFLIACPPFTAVHFAALAWPFGHLACQLMHCATNVTVYVTVYTLVLICVVRYMAIVHNSNTHKWRTRKKIGVIILLVWIVMIAVAVPFGKVFGVRTYQGSTVCVVVDLEYGKRLFTFSCIFAYFLPVLVMGSLSVFLLRHIQGQSKVNNVPLRSTGSERTRQAGRVVKLVVLAFVLLWLPTNIDLLWFYYGCAGGPLFCTPAKWLQVFEVLARCLAYSNSCINPVIYNFASREFRRHFWEVLHCTRRGGQGTAVAVTSTYYRSRGCSRLVSNGGQA